MNKLISGLVGLCIGVSTLNSLNKIHAQDKSQIYQDTYKLIECLDLNKPKNIVGIALQNPNVSKLYFIYLTNGEEIRVIYRDYPPHGKLNKEDYIFWDKEKISMNPSSESGDIIKKLLKKYCP